VLPGKTVRRLREDQGYSQEGFAAKAKISRTYMSEVERGVTVVSLDVIGRIARGLGTTMSGLLKHVEESR
jgi:transcriptional regulator with XRE-family HTH domain